MGERTRIILSLLKRYRWVALLGFCVLMLFFAVSKPEKPDVRTPTNFTKTPTEDAPEEGDAPDISAEELEITVEGERQFNESVKTFAEKYPWYSSIPIDKEEYVIVYDFERGLFRIRIKEGYAPNNQQTIQSALNDIKEIGADPTKYYIINP